MRIWFRHMGHSLLRVYHWVMQAQWNMCPHTSVLSDIPSRHIEHMSHSDLLGSKPMFISELFYFTTSGIQGIACFFLCLYTRQIIKVITKTPKSEQHTITIILSMGPKKIVFQESPETIFVFRGWIGTGVIPQHNSFISFHTSPSQQTVVQLVVEQSTYITMSQVVSLVDPVVGMEWLKKTVQLPLLNFWDRQVQEPNRDSWSDEDVEMRIGVMLFVPLMLILTDVARLMGVLRSKRACIFILKLVKQPTY